MKLSFAVALLLSLSVLGQDKPTYRSEFALAEKAANAGNNREYLEHMKSAMALEPDPSGRPYYQYNLARAQALNGLHAEAVATLGEAWKERVEGPIIYFADLDPAFAGTRTLASYKRLMSQFDTLEIQVVPIAGNVVEIRGAGCNMAASIGPDGVLLVDSGYPRTAPAVMRALKKHIGSDPRVRYIINTHGHFDHMASNEAYGRHAVVIAHPQAAALAKAGDEYVPGFRIPPLSSASLPDVMTDAQLTVPFNGEDIRVFALPAHTDGDLIVYFPTSKVVHMGDNYFPSTSARLYPGQSISRFFETLGPFVAALPEDAMILSGHDSPVAAAVLKKTFADSENLYQLVRDAVAAGKSQQEIREEAASKGQPARWADYYYRALRKN